MGAAAVNRTMNVLRSMARPRLVLERCELCAAELAANHQHLFEPGKRKVMCACPACSLLFSGSDTRYKRVPRRVRLLANFSLSEAQWDRLAIPINMAFFFMSSPDERTVALYPSPAGPVESLLPLDAWKDLVQENPALAEMEPDVEALLVNRVGQSRGAGAAEYFVVPIDECYKLVGLIRGSWRGFSGGTEVWQEIGKFFAGLKERACLT
ncbi:MAG TPA: DUF5947 family protein [Bryobacteraceae bacterium]|jgi:hypothetical protein